MILTEQGELLYRTAHEVFAKLAMAEAQLSESKDRPKGQLKVTTTVALGSTWLTPRMGEFLEVYPDVAVDLLLDDRELDLSMREADVAIRMAPPRQPELIQRHLMTVHMHVYAAPTYIKRYGLPKSAEELDSLFQPFRGTFPKGSGLGLAIVHRIVTDYNGEIQVSSRPGAGTTVSVRLPARAVAATT